MKNGGLVFIDRQPAVEKARVFQEVAVEGRRFPRVVVLDVFGGGGAAREELAWKVDAVVRGSYFAKDVCEGHVDVDGAVAGCRYCRDVRCCSEQKG